MVRALLIRGMLVGVLAGLLAFGFSKTFGEPQVDRAIAFEAAIDQAKAKEDAAMGMVHEPETELVSRWVQAGPGLFTGVVVYSAAFGGLFALVFAAANGRIGGLGSRGVAALLAAVGFVSVTLVPGLKYPANPPAAAAPETIGIRTAMFFLMLLISVVAMTGAAILRDRLAPRQGGWTAALIAAAAYVLVVACAAVALPVTDEVPVQFPADLLWRFRIASLGTQAVMWATIGLVFGWLTERATMPDHRVRFATAAGGPLGRPGR